MTDADRETLEAIAAAQEADVIALALDAARARLRMQAAYVSHIDLRRQHVDALTGDGAAMALGVGTEIPIRQTFCSRMLKGEVPNVVPDTRAAPEISHLPAARLIGAYVGVPITLADGRLHGTLCCASSAPQAHLGEDELAFMRLLAEMVAARIERARAIASG